MELSKYEMWVPGRSPRNPPDTMLIVDKVSSDDVVVFKGKLGERMLLPGKMDTKAKTKIFGKDLSPGDSHISLSSDGVIGQWDYWGVHDNYAVMIMTELGCVDD